MGRSSMPSRLNIYKHWIDWLNENERPEFICNFGGDVDVNMSDKWNHQNLRYWCFACGKQSPVERAHINPYSTTQDNRVENLHLLCLACHKESEPWVGSVYYAWFMGKQPTIQNYIKISKPLIDYIISIDFEKDIDIVSITKIYLEQGLDKVKEYIITKEGNK
jgi:hypothetical protein